MAVLLAEGIWGVLVSLVRDLVLPALARVMETEPQSPLYLGKGDFNVTAVFSAILQFCLAAIVAVLLNAWIDKKPRPRRARVVRAPSVPATPVPARVQATSQAPAAVSAPAVKKEEFCSPPAASAAGTPPPPASPAAKPTKPNKPKEVYYNLVGEAITPDDE